MMNTQTESKTLLPAFTVVKRAVIYNRVSTDEQAESGTSLGNQDDKNNKYAAINNMRVVYTGNEDFTGITLDRPELNKIRTMLRAGQADCLIVYKTNRLDRSEWGINLLILLKELKQLGVELHYSQSGRQNDLSNPVEALMQSIEGWQAGEDRKEVVRRLYEGRVSRVEQGGVIINQKPPYGYQLVKEGKKFMLEIDEIEAAIIRLIFHGYTVGEKGVPMSMGQIRHKLIEMQIPTYADTGKRTVPRKKERPFGQ
jgi:site-specific DNA recombinase